MLDPRSFGARSSLLSGITASATTIKVPTDQAGLFALATGSHLYLTLRSGTAKEVIKVTGRSGGMMTVQRGADGTSARSWPAGTCVTVEWNPAALCEFIQQCMQGGPDPTGVEPGTYCLSACHCITVAGDGRITKIEG